MITPRMTDILWQEREAELNRRAELARRMNDGEVVLSDHGNYRIVDWASRLIAPVRGWLGMGYVRVPAHEPPSDVPCS